MPVFAGPYWTAEAIAGQIEAHYAMNDRNRALPRHWQPLVGRSFREANRRQHMDYCRWNNDPREAVVIGGRVYYPDEQVGIRL